MCWGCDGRESGMAHGTFDGDQGLGDIDRMAILFALSF